MGDSNPQLGRTLSQTAKWINHRGRGPRSKVPGVNPNLPVCMFCDFCAPLRGVPENTLDIHTPIRRPVFVYLVIVFFRGWCIRQRAHSTLARPVRPGGPTKTASHCTGLREAAGTLMPSVPRSRELRRENRSRVTRASPSPPALSAAEVGVQPLSADGLVDRPCVPSSPLGYEAQHELRSHQPI